jgi:hypothetical protein
VDRKCIRDWISKRELLESKCNIHRKQLSGGGRKLTSTQLDDLLFTMIIDKQMADS